MAYFTGKTVRQACTAPFCTALPPSAPFFFTGVPSYSGLKKSCYYLKFEFQQISIRERLEMSLAF